MIPALVLEAVLSSEVADADAVVVDEVDCWAVELEAAGGTGCALSGAIEANKVEEGDPGSDLVEVVLVGLL